MKNIWDKTKVMSAIEQCKTIKETKGGYPFPRAFLCMCGWDVETYQENLIQYKLDTLKKDKQEVFDLLKSQIDLLLSYVQELMLKGSITPGAYETTVKEFETNGVSIKENALHTKDRFEKLKRQKEEQINVSGIKLC